MPTETSKITFDALPPILSPRPRKDRWRSRLHRSLRRLKDALARLRRPRRYLDVLFVVKGRARVLDEGRGAREMAEEPHMVALREALLGQPPWWSAVSSAGTHLGPGKAEHRSSARRQ